MAEHATGTFTVQSWDESTYQQLGEPGGKSGLARARMVFAFSGGSGGLEAEGTSDTLMFYREDGTANFTGLQRMTGTLGGRSGSFVLLAGGSYDGTEARTQWQVLDGSGTGDLAGLRGTGVAAATSTPPGTFSFDYELG